MSTQPLNSIALPGCRPEPIAAYLKALGILRLVSEQKDSEARGFWQTGQFVLITRLSEAELRDFFVDEYVPTPIIAPWNGASGFWDRTTAGRARQAVAGSVNSRYGAYREAMALAERILRELGIASKDDIAKDRKLELLARLRSRLPELAVRWLDAACLITDEKIVYPPVLGTGANDGKLEFTANFMLNLLRLIRPDCPAPGADKVSRALLEASLTGNGDAELINSSIGQFDPGGVGGANAFQGFEGPSLVNPWDFVLMIEGTLMLAGAAAWRMASGSRGASAPFTVTMTAAGWGSAIEWDERDAQRAKLGAAARAELWLPLWGNPATAEEIAHLMGEGRAQVGRRAARTGVDFARAIAGLGVDRGLAGFQRFGLVQRNGRAFLAAPLGQMAVKAQPHVNLLTDLDAWLDSLRRAKVDYRPLERHVRAIEDAMFAFCQSGGPVALQRVLIAVGRAEAALATSGLVRAKDKPNQADRPTVAPLQGLSPGWLAACDDGSPEFRLAAAIASVGRHFPGDIRANFEPVAASRKGISGRPRWEWDPDSTVAAQTGGGLPARLRAALARRCIDAAREGLAAVPIAGGVAAELADINAFLRGEVALTRIEDLLQGLLCLDWTGVRPPARWRRDSWAPTLDRTYALLKLLFLPETLQHGGTTWTIGVGDTGTILARLTAHDIAGATAVAVRRLEASGLALPAQARMLAEDLSFAAADPETLAAALIIPVRHRDRRGDSRLAELVLNPSDTDDDKSRSVRTDSPVWQRQKTDLI